MWNTRFIVGAATVVVASLAVIAGSVMLLEDSFIYFPTRYPDGDWTPVLVPPRGGEARIEDCFFTAVDGVKLHGWYCAPQRQETGIVRSVDTKVVLLYFHGNAGNLTYRLDMIQLLVQIPVDVFIIDYRGYGKSEGTPTEEGLYGDADAAWRELTVTRGTHPDRIVIFGKSLGGAPAIDLARRVSAAGLIVQSSFTSAADMAEEVMPFVPRFLLRTKFDSIGKVHAVSCPKLFIHSPADEVVPYKLGRRLYDAAPPPKQFFEVPRAGHNETHIAGGRPYFDALRAFIDSCASRATPRS